MNEVVKVDSRVKTVRDLVTQLKPQMAAALPAHITADRMARIVMTQVQQNPALLNCDKGSLLQSVMTACQLGLEPDGVLGHGYLVPYGPKCQFIPGYRGYIKLAQQSGEIKEIYAMDVRENDKFKIVDGLNRDLQHERAAGARGEVVGFYAVAKYLNGGFDFKYLTAAEVNEVRDNSQGYKAWKAGKIKETPWATSYVPMGLKTAIRQLAKFLPLSVQKAAALEDEFERGRHATIDGDHVVVTEALDDAANPAEKQEEGKAAAKTKLDKFVGAPPPGFPPKPGTKESVEQGYEKPAPEFDEETGETD